MSLRDALQITGHLNPDYVELDRGDYYFVAEDTSVFVVGEYKWPRSWFSSDHRIFVGGPRAGQTEDITSEQLEAHRKEAEAIWGKYIPGTYFQDPRFIPGTQRDSLPLYRIDPITGLRQEKIGYIGEKGVHRYGLGGDPFDVFGSRGGI